MIDINQQQILNTISDITFSDNIKLVSIISKIIIKDKNIGFAIDIFGKDSKEIDEIKIKAINKLNETPNTGEMTIVLTSSKGVAKKSTNPKVKHLIDGVKKIILVASGKLGVGISTITALIAEQLNLEGYKIGIVDADIYGPSIPQIICISGVPEIVYNKVTPLKS